MEEENNNSDISNISGSDNPKPKLTKRLGFIILTVAIVIAGVLFFKDLILEKASDGPDQNIQSEQLDIEYRPNTQSELPPEITEDMLFGDNVQIIQNYRYEDENGGIQNTVKYTTKSQPTLIRADFLNYFDQNRWQVNLDESTLDSFIMFVQQFPQDEQEQFFKEVLITGNSTADNNRIITISLTTRLIKPI